MTFRKPFAGKPWLAGTKWQTKMSKTCMMYVGFLYLLYAEKRGMAEDFSEHSAYMTIL